MKILGVEFEPLYVPWKRRLETLAAVHYITTFLFGHISCVVLFTVLLCSPYYYVGLVYLVWLIYDFNVCDRGGRRLGWMRRWKMWDYFRNYFPMRLFKTVDLDPNRNYIFGFHPHGLMGIASIGTFGTDSADVRRLFPGITITLMTLPMQLRIPLFREYMLGMGLCSASRKSIEYWLTKRGQGNAVVVVVGGAEEALEAHANRSVVKLTLKNRKGLIKIALRQGVPLVPVISFGENEIFSQAANPKGSSLRKFQNKFKQWFGFSPVFFNGRGIFQYSFGILPYRIPINTYVGAPLHVEHIEEPTNEQVDHYHTKYIQSLQQLFEHGKSQLGHAYQNHTLELC